MGRKTSVEEIIRRCEKVGLEYISHETFNCGNKRGTNVMAKCQCGEPLKVENSTLKSYVDKNKKYHCRNCAIKIQQEKRMQDNTNKFKELCEKVGLVYVSHHVENGKFYIMAKCKCGKDIKIYAGDLGKYAKENKIYSCRKCSQKKRGLESRMSVEEIIRRCEAVNLKYISHDYINTDEEHLQIVVDVKCQCGEIINNVRLSNITEKMKKNEIYVCKKCANKKMSEFRMGSHPSEETRRKMSENRKGKCCGENHHNWMGGMRNIKTHLRNLPCVLEWGMIAREQANYTCQLTGLKSKELERGKLPVHHLYAFSSIVLDAHNTYNIEVKQQVKDYTNEELKLLEDYVAEWHKDTTNAVVLCEEVHRLFHDVFMGGCKNSTTKEDFEEFKTRYLNGEFDTKAEDVA